MLKHFAETSRLAIIGNAGGVSLVSFGYGCFWIFALICVPLHRDIIYFCV